LTFVGSSYGLLLGLLVVFAVGHFNDVQTGSQQEASSLVSLYDTVGVYPTQTSDHIRHDLVCYMRSIVQDEWPSWPRSRLDWLLDESVLAWKHRFATLTGPRFD
jgi:hypothetical protein